MLPLPNLPDNSHRIIMLYGVAFIIGGFYLIHSFSLKTDIIYTHLNGLIDSASVKQAEANILKDELIDADSTFSLKYKRPRLISVNDSMTYFNRIISGDSLAVIYTDSIKKYWIEWEMTLNQIKIINKRIELVKGDLERTEKTENGLGIMSLILICYGGLIFNRALYKLEMRESLGNELLKSKNIGLPRYFSNCQSCSRKFSPLLSYGFESDQKTNYAFCIECYSNGEFTESNISLTEMENKVSEWAKPLQKRRQKKIINGVKTLERWKQDKF